MAVLVGDERGQRPPRLGQPIAGAVEGAYESTGIGHAAEPYHEDTRCRDPVSVHAEDSEPQRIVTAKSTASEAVSTYTMKASARRRGSVPRAAPLADRTTRSVGSEPPVGRSGIAVPSSRSTSHEPEASGNGASASYVTRTDTVEVAADVPAEGLGVDTVTVPTGVHRG